MWAYQPESAQPEYAQPESARLGDDEPRTRSAVRPGWGEQSGPSSSADLAELEAQERSIFAAPYDGQAGGPGAGSSPDREEVTESLQGAAARSASAASGASEAAVSPSGVGADPAAPSEGTAQATNGRVHDLSSRRTGARPGRPGPAGAGGGKPAAGPSGGPDSAGTADLVAEAPTDGSDAAAARASGAASPHTARLAVPRGWASDSPPEAEPGGPIADPRTTNAPVSPRHGGPHAFAKPPGGAGPWTTSTGPTPAVSSADDQTHTAPPPFGGPQHEPPLRPAAPLPRDTSRDAAHWTDPVAVAAQDLQRARQSEGTDLSSARLLRHAKRPPQSGWRRMMYVLSGRMLNPGESPTDIRRRELTMRVNQPLLGCYKIAMLSLKGGVGKTTMTATLGATFASLRGDRVVAVDANPDRGTLSQKIPLETSATVRNLLRDAQRVRRYTDVRAYTSQGPSRLEVLASEQDPAVSEAFSDEDYRRTIDLLEHFYNIVLTDCGTGLMHSAMYGVLGVADQLVIVSSGSIDGARSASATMDWLDAHGHGELVSNSVVVINFVHRSRGGVDLNRVSEHFAARCRAVVRIPFDAHLEEGAEIDLDRLEPRTRMALLDLAANVADAFESVHAL
ncbi:MAG: AAA family ATPase [Pseudonocardiales bacterium]|nr:AAA family ATPase [Pseudonocardiales bacterium]